MALVKSGLEIEIKGIKQALDELGMLDRIQDQLALSADNVIITISGMNKSIGALNQKTGTLNNALNPDRFTNFGNAANIADSKLDGFSQAVQATVPHLRNIATASNDLNTSGLNTLSNLQIKDESIRIAATSVEKLKQEFQELNVILDGPVVKNIQEFTAALSKANIGNGSFGTEINQLALGFRKLNEIKDLSAISANLNKFLDVLRRLSAIEVGGALSDLDRLAPALKAAGDGFREFNKTTNIKNTSGLDGFINVVKEIAKVPLTKISGELPIFAVALGTLAEAFKKFASGAPGEKLPSALKAVTLALSELVKISAKDAGKGIVDLGTALGSVATPLSNFAKAMRDFTTGKGITDLPARAKDIKAAMLDIRNAFNFKDIDTLAPKLQQLSPALRDFANAFKAFSTGKNTNSLPANIAAVSKALNDFSKIKLGDLSADLTTLGPGIEKLALAFRAFTTGTNIGDLPQRIQAIVNAINSLKNVRIESLGPELQSVVKPLGEFFGAFRLFSGSEKFADIGKRFGELQKGLNDIKKLNLGSFAKELKEVSVGLESLVKAAALVNSKNLSSISATLTALRAESQKATLANRALALSYTYLINPVKNVANGLGGLAAAIIRLPINIFINQLKFLRAVFIGFPIAVLTKGFQLFFGAINLVQKAFSGFSTLVAKVANIFKALSQTMNNLGIIVKALLFPIVALVNAFNSIINVGSKVSSIFTAFKVNQVANDTKVLSENLKNTNVELTKTAATTTRANAEFVKTDAVLTQVGQESQRATTGVRGMSGALSAINVAQVTLLGLGIAGATKKILAFAAAAKSLEVISNVFQRLNMVVRQFGGQIIGGAFEATSTFEQQTLQITSLLAKEFVKLGKAGSVQEALQLDELNATFNESLAIIKRLAIESPFDNKDIITVFRMASSFGFMREEALDMTRILTDASAALGLTGSDASEIAKVFGQIKSLGKLLAGDVNQLAQRGINVKTILKDVGLTMADVQGGALDADQAIQLILTSLDRDFGGSAARATNTLAGLASTFTSLRDDVLRTTFTPLFDALKPFGAELLAPFQNTDFLEKVTQFGEVLRDNVLGVITGIVRPIVFLTTAFINLPKPIQQAIFFAAKFAATALAVSTAVAVVQAGIVLFGTTLAFIFNPISLTVGALISLATVAYTGREAITSFANAIGGSIYARLLDLAKVFPVIGNALNGLQSVFIRIKTGFNSLFEPSEATKLARSVDTFVQSTNTSLSSTTGSFNEVSFAANTTAKALGLTGTLAKNMVASFIPMRRELSLVALTGEQVTEALDIKPTGLENTISTISTSINGFNNSINNLFSGIQNTIQPGIDAVSAGANSIVAAFNTAGVEVTSIGQSILLIFGGIGQTILDELGKLGTGISERLGGLGTFFADFLTSVTDFGGGLIDAFSQGILTSLNYVADALLAIAELVTFWLEPGSPPRLLPDIDKWGAGLILSWIDGMTATIGPAFQGLGGIIEKAAAGIFSVFIAIGKFTFDTIINSIIAFGGIFTQVFSSLVAVGTAFIGQIALIFNLIANSFLVAIDPALSFKDKFIRILNEVGYFISGTFVNVGVLVASVAQDIVNSLLIVSQFVINEFVIGFNAIKMIFPQLDGLSTRIADFSNKSLANLQTFGNGAATFFADLLDTVTDYGSALISAFSDGIIGAVSVVSQALSYLGDQIAYWLAPGSPPRLLPEIDKWGTAAAGEFLGGFSSADFSKIEDFGSTAEKLLENINLDPGIDINFQGIFEGFAGALAQGSLGEDTFAEVSAVAPQAAAELQLLASTYFSVEDASKKLEEANEKVAASQAKVTEETEKIAEATKTYDDQIAELEGRLTDIDTASTYDAEIKKIAQLQDVINSRYTSEYEQMQAQREIEKIRNTQQLRQLKAAKAANEANLRAAEAELSANEKMAQQSESNVDKSQEELDALKARLDLAAKFASENSGLGADGSLGGSDADEDGKKLKGKKIKIPKGEDLVDAFDLDSALAIGEAGFANFNNKIRTAFDDFRDKIQGVRDGVNAFFDNIREKFGRLQEVFKPVTDAVYKLFTNTNFLKTAFVALGVILAGPLIIGALTTLATIIGGIVIALGPFTGTLLLLTGALGGAGFGAYLLGQNLAEASGLFGESSAILNDVVNSLLTIGSTIGTVLSNFGSGFITGLFADGQTFLSAILGFDVTDLSTISASLGNLAAELVQEFIRFNLIIFKSFTGILLGNNPIDTFLTELTGKDYSGTFEQFATKLGNDLRNYVIKAFNLFESNIASSGVLAGVTKTLGTLISEAFANLGNAVAGVANFDLSTISFDLGGITLTGGPELGTKLAGLLGESFNFLTTIDFSTPATVIQSTFETAFNTIQPIVSQKFLEFMTLVFGSNSQSVIDGLTTTLDNIGLAFDRLFNNINKQGLAGGILQTIFGDGAQAILANFSIALSGLESVFGLVGSAFNTFLANIEASGLADSLINLGNQILYASQEILKLIGPLVAGAVGGAFVLLLEVFKELPFILTNVIDLFANLFERIGNIAKAITDLVLGNISFGQFLSEFFGNILGIFSDIGVFIDGIGDNIANAVKGFISTIGDLIGIDVQPFLDSFGFIIDIIADITSSLLLGWVFKLATQFNRLTNIFTKTSKPLTELDKAFIFIGQKVANLFTGISRLFGSFGKLGTSIKNVLPSTTSFTNAINTIGGLAGGVLKAFFTFATSSFAKFNATLLGVLGIALLLKNGIIETFTAIRDGISEKINAINTFFSALELTNPFASLSTAIFGEEGFVSKIQAVPASFDGLFASVVIANPLAFFDDFFPLFKLAIGEVPGYFTGLLDTITIVNPFDALNDFLFSETGFVSKVLGIGSSFVTTAEDITGINIIDPFEAIKITLGLVKIAVDEIPGLITNLSKAINELTVTDVFAAIAESTNFLVEGAQNLLEIDLSGFSNVFAPVTATIDGLVEKFNNLTQTFKDAANLVPGINIGGAELSGVEVIQEKIKTEFGNTPVSSEQKLDLIFEDPNLSTKASALLQEFETAYDNASGPLGTNFAAINKELIAKGFSAEDIIAVAKAAGLSIEEGFAEGFTSDTSATTREARALATNTLLELKDALGIQSPSTEAKDQIGIPVVEGIIEPFSDTTLIQPAITTLVNNLLAELTAQVESKSNSIKEAINNALTPKFQESGAELGTALATSTATTLSNADIPVELTTDFNAIGTEYGTALGGGFTTGLDTELSKSTGLTGITTLFKNTFTGITATLNKFKISLSTSLNGLYSSFNQITSTFSTNMIRLWSVMFDSLIELMEEFVDEFIELLEDFLEAITTNVEDMFDNIVSLFASFINSILNSYSVFTTELVRLTTVAVINIINQFKRLETELVPIIERAIDAATAAMRKIVDAFRTIGTDAVDAFIEQVDTMLDRTVGAIDIFITEILDLYSGTGSTIYAAGRSIGVNFINGWIFGIESRLPALLVVVGNMVDSMVAKVESELLIESPSRVMFRLGEFTGDGLAMGIQNKISAVSNSMKMLTDSVVNSGFKNKVTNFINKDIFGTMNNIKTEGLLSIQGAAQRHLIDMNTGQNITSYSPDYQRLIASSSNVSNSYVTNNSYAMTVNTKQDRVVPIRRKFRTMEFIGV
jgi:hypothetical protein